MSTPEQPLLFITSVLPGTGFGAGERSTSLLHALRAVGPTRLLLLRHPWHAPVRPGECDHVIDAIAPGAWERGYYWRRQIAAGPVRTEPRLVRELARILEREPVRAILCRYSTTLALDAPRFAPSMIDIDDVPTDFRSRIPGIGPLRRRLLGRALRDYRAVFVTKPLDIDKVPHAQVRVLPCISTSVTPLADAGEGASLLFLGSSAHPPNAQGVERFVRSVWPQVHARVPGATLTLAGSGWEKHGQVPGVRTPGFVPSLQDAYREASAVVCPIWSGAGACVKLAEAAGFGRAIIAAGHAASGYEGLLVPGEDLLLASDDEAFVAHCVAVLRDRTLRDRLGRSARQKAAAMLSPQAMERIIRDALETRCRV